MKKMRVIAAVVMLCLLTGLMAGCSILNGDVIVSVNGEKVYNDEFVWYLSIVQQNMLQNAGVSTAEQANTFWMTTEIEGKNAADVAKERAVENAVLTKVLCQKAAEMGISLTDEDKNQIQQQINTEINEVGGRMAYEKRLEELGTTSDGYTKFVETMQLAGKVESQIMQQPEYVVTEDQARASIKDTYITAKHILLTTMDEATGVSYEAAEIEAVKAQADDLYNQIMNGADFDKLMNEYCQDPGLATNPDGYTFGKGQMVPEFEETAYALEIGAVSKPVQTDYGFHIIKREELKLTDADIETYLATEMQVMQYQKINEAYEQWKNSATVEIKEDNLAKVSIIQ